MLRSDQVYIVGGQNVDANNIPSTELTAQTDQPPLEWDEHLTALKVSLEAANAPNGSTYWRLIRATYDATPRGRSIIFCEVQNEKGERLLGQKVILSWPGGSGHAITENKPAPELAANFPIGASYDPTHGPGPYSVHVDGLPSDRVSGLGRPKGADAIFYLTWRRSVAGPTLSQSTIRGMVIGGQVGQTVILRSSRGDTRQTKLDAAGSYVFTGLPAGTYTIEVGGFSLPGLRVDGTSSLEVAVIDLRPKQSIIKGTVRKASGEVVVGATVTITGIGFRSETITDAKGVYQFTNLVEGTYTVEVAGMIQTARVTGRDQVTLDFQLPAEATKKLIAQYLLFGPPEQVGTRANLVLAEDYILKFMPTVGFSVDEAMHAATVIIVGDIQAVSAEDEERLKASDCQVTRLGGGPYAIEQAFAELIKGKGLSPVPSARLRGPGKAGKGNEGA